MKPAATPKVLPPIDSQTGQLTLLLEQAVMRFGRNLNAISPPFIATLGCTEFSHDEL